MRLPNSLVEIARANGGLATLTSARTAGVSSQQLTDLVRAGLIARVARGVYSIGSVTTSRHDPAHLTIAWRVALSGPSAVAWWGVDLPVAPGLLHVTAPRSRGRWRDAAPGVRLSRANLANSEIAILRGVRVTTPLRTALDYARKAPFNHAVAVVDGSCAQS